MRQVREGGLRSLSAALLPTAPAVTPHRAFFALKSERRLLGFTWWSVFLELFVLLGITATLFLPDPERYKIPAVAYLAVATVRLGAAGSTNAK